MRVRGRAADAGVDGSTVTAGVDGVDGVDGAGGMDVMRRLAVRAKDGQDSECGGLSVPKL
jgi:hypothetical protein